MQANELKEVKVQNQVQVHVDEYKFIVEKKLVQLGVIIRRSLILLYFLWLFLPLIYGATTGPCSAGGQYCPDNYYSVLILPGSVGVKNIVSLCCAQNVTLQLARVEKGVCCQIPNNFYFAAVLLPLTFITIIVFVCILYRTTDITGKAKNFATIAQELRVEQLEQAQIPIIPSELPADSMQLIDPNVRLFAHRPPSPPSYSSLSPLLEMSNAVNNSSDSFTVSLGPLPSAPPQSIDEWSTGVWLDTRQSQQIARASTLAFVW